MFKNKIYKVKQLSQQTFLYIIIKYRYNAYKTKNLLIK